MLRFLELDYMQWFDEGGDGGNPKPKPNENQDPKPNANNAGSDEGKDLKTVEKEAYLKGQKETKRELSSKLNINLFDEKELDSFVQSLSNKVDKSELEKYETELEELKKTKDEYEELKLENVLVKSNVNEKYIDRAKQLIKTDVEAKGVSYEEAAQNIVKEMPFFVQTKRGVGMDHNSDPDNLSEADSYIKRKYKNNPYMKD